MKTKKRKSLFCSFLIISFLIILNGKLHGQNHSFGITYEPSIATSLISDFQYSTNPPSIHRLSSRYAYTCGVDYTFIFNSKTHGLKTGLYIVDAGYKETINRDEPVFLDRTDRVYYQYLSIPIEFYKTFDNIFFNVGPNLNYSFKEYRILGTGKITEYDIYDHFVLGIKAGFGIHININDNLKLRFGAFNRFFFAETKMNYGFIIGLNYEI